MSEVPIFFIPGIALNEQENAYEYYARQCDCALPDQGKRVYSLVWTHDATLWTATVGQRLTGIERRIIGSGRNKSEHRIPIDDSAIVLAIFFFISTPTGDLYRVRTDGGMRAQRRSAWESILNAGKVSTAVYFEI